MNTEDIKMNNLKYIGTKWVPNVDSGPNPLHWKCTDVFYSATRKVIALQIEKYQGGRNSPAIITLPRLKRRFNRVP